VEAAIEDFVDNSNKQRSNRQVLEKDRCAKMG